MGDRRVPRTLPARAGLAATIVLAVLVLGGVSTALLAFDPRVTSADALRTGGLAAGSVVALYALWLNDRRRRVEEDRQGTERERQALEHDRVADERFARAVELLGHETDQVRVGALHALAGLARSNPDHAQTVLDVLCSYLRRPFDHPRDVGGEWTQEQVDEAQRMLQVRLTAQRLIADLLPRAGEADAPVLDLDLTGATLEYFDLSQRLVGSVVLRHARLFSSNNFSRSTFRGPVWFTGSRVGSEQRGGRFRCDGSVFHDKAWFPRVRFSGLASFEGTSFRGPAKFTDSTFAEPPVLGGAEFLDHVEGAPTEPVEAP